MHHRSLGGPISHTHTHTGTHTHTHNHNSFAYSCFAPRVLAYKGQAHQADPWYAIPQSESREHSLAMRFQTSAPFVLTRLAAELLRGRLSLARTEIEQAVAAALGAAVLSWPSGAIQERGLRSQDCDPEAQLMIPQ